MSKPLQESSPEKTSSNGSARPAMVYMCECGTKWTNSQEPAWECKCGRQLVKRNGIIHADICQTSGQTISAPQIFHTAAG